MHEFISRLLCLRLGWNIARKLSFWMVVKCILQEIWGQPWALLLQARVSNAQDLKRSVAYFRQVVRPRRWQKTVPCILSLIEPSSIAFATSHSMEAFVHRYLHCNLIATEWWVSSRGIVPRTSVRRFYPLKCFHVWYVGSKRLATSPKPIGYRFYYIGKY